ncbi:MAG: hypothetical protein K2V38_18290, partial [Gemmataceae bacterium]|nr:hypothetical protein [Gemmataceae bacterium]
MKLFRLSALALVLVLIAGGAGASDDKDPVPLTPLVRPNPAEKFETTHKVVGAIEVKGENNLRLQTLCLDTKGRVVGLVAPPKPFGPPTKGATAEIHLFEADGKAIKSWKVDFHASAVNCGPDGHIYVAGDGKLAKFDADGKQVGATAEMPHVAAMLNDKDALKARAEKQLKKEKEQMVQIYGEARKQFAEQIKTLEDKKPEDRTKAEVRQLEQFKSLVKQYEQIEEQYKKKTVEQVIEEGTGRMRMANGLAVSGKDVFVACGDLGYGFSIWRFGHDLKEPKLVLGDVSGCCGQMDIQCAGSDLLVAENTKHQFARYDRDGKKLGGYGKRGEDTDPKCFGGCCNPMNVRAISTGDVYTAESEGIIKRFNAKGEFVETAAVVKLTGGCKDVAVAVSADGSKIYFCDMPNS